MLRADLLRPSMSPPGPSLLLLLLLSRLSLSLAVGPDITARDRLVKDLPNGVFAGRKLTPKVRLGGVERAEVILTEQVAEKTVIEMRLSIRSIDLDFKSGVFSMSGMMTLEWTDSRYVWDPFQWDGVESVPLPFSTVWTPEVILHNSLEEKFMFRQVGLLNYTGNIVYAIAVHTKSSCAPNFSNFPWGVQVCSLKFGSWINSQYNVEYRLSSSNTTIGLGDFQQTVGWEVVNTKSR